MAESSVPLTSNEGASSASVSDDSTSNSSCRDVTIGIGGHVKPKGAPAERAQWGRQIEFVLSCVGFAVGLGNVWRFPYLCYKNGGGAFLVPYFIMLLLVGVPIFFLELAFGQFASLGPISNWSFSPLFKGVGVCAVMICGVINIYYNIVLDYCIYFFFASMTQYLPWETCDNWWNTCKCKGPDVMDNATWINLTRPECIDSYYNGNLTLADINNTQSPSAEFYNNNVLGLSSGIEDMGSLSWKLVLVHLLAWLVVFCVLIKGVQSFGKVVYFSAIFPYILLTALLIRGVTLPGAIDGITYYIKPKWSKLLEASVWSEAAAQIFYSLSACQGGLVAMASYNRFNNNCMRDAFIIPVINCMTSFYAGFVIFSVLGFMAYEKGVNISAVADEGPGLAFIVYPEAISKMPIAPLWALLFFFMMMTLGFSTQFSGMETVITSVIDEYPKLLRQKVPSILCRLGLVILTCILGIPMATQGGQYLLTLIDANIGGYPFLVVGLMELITLNWIYGYNRFAEDIEMMIGRKPFIYFRIMWCFVSPGILVALIVFSAIQTQPLTMGDYVYPGWANALGWIITAIPIGCIPGWMVYYIWREAGSMKLLKKVISPKPEWGPYLQVNRKGRYTCSDLMLQRSDCPLNGPNIGTTA
ncbi:sodium- and chloride-dependent glycine transporter 1-like isoform X2 [Liolophura sinensis]|uniref:sodium- and chloride-dependent glycine transporter 1-like isoform X2 n=1 Tax=Liolophura sinensis TaxID=3198878 RepID=UPI003157FE3B